MKGNEGWHTDSSFRDVPASFSLFACVVAPDEGGDTFFASLQRGWEKEPQLTGEQNLSRADRSLPNNL